MKIHVNGTEIFAATGGKDFDPSKPVAIFIHGAGFDHSTWALYTRWHAHNGYSVDRKSVVRARVWYPV
jgi:pimeloyl-ACP methyl ester carboxylesterase